MSGRKARANRALLAGFGEFDHPGRRRRLAKQEMLPSKALTIEGVIGIAGGILGIVGGHSLDNACLSGIGYITAGAGTAVLALEGYLYRNYHKRMRQ